MDVGAILRTVGRVVSWPFRQIGRLIAWCGRQIASAIRRGSSAPNDPLAILFFGTVLFAIGIALIAALIEVWPAVQATTGKPSAATNAPAAVAKHVHFLFGLFTIRTTADTSLLVLVVVAGALGAYIHAATSFADYVGNQRFVASWTWWYALRLFIGVSLAVLLYFALRAGFLNGTSTSVDVNPYGVATLAALAGLFSKQATDKLREVFETMFRVSPTGGDAVRKDALTNPVPAITATEPVHAAIGQELALQVAGTGFVPGTFLMVGNTTVQTTFDKASGKLRATLSASLVSGDALKLVAVNPSPGGGKSPAFVLPVSP